MTKNEDINVLKSFLHGLYFQGKDYISSKKEVTRLIDDEDKIKEAEKSELLHKYNKNNEAIRIMNFNENKRRNRIEFLEENLNKGLLGTINLWLVGRSRKTAMKQVYNYKNAYEIISNKQEEIRMDIKNIDLKYQEELEYSLKFNNDKEQNCKDMISLVKSNIGKMAYDDIIIGLLLDKIENAAGKKITNISNCVDNISEEINNAFKEEDCFAFGRLKNGIHGEEEKHRIGVLLELVVCRTMDQNQQLKEKIDKGIYDKLMSSVRNLPNFLEALNKGGLDDIVESFVNGEGSTYQLADNAQLVEQKTEME